MKIFNEHVLTEIIDSPYPTDMKVHEIMALHRQAISSLLNNVGNEIGLVIDGAKDNALHVNFEGGEEND